ncbi:iron chelate uptake ABC transporter family permease subunit [Amycolatopsis sp. K13G38]|uniref:Iron chelate uptake ABC transporter family permease subunit n=1 Tax=Amycolatopsis acididurans TaxID=2724524 RepID=A0ABX1IZ53_9PSEU|nr:iron chelate uptake ABC transporter family permease subunit [Amycolatopsis acididurans]
MLAAAVVASIAVGAKGIPPPVVFDALLHHDPANPDHLIVTGVRVPRTIIGLLAGAALGAGGTIIQGVTRNPLADPGVLGINAGASLLVLIAISVFGVGTMTGYVWFGFLGAALAALVVYLVGSFGRDGATPLKLALAGAACMAAFGSVTTGILVTDDLAFDQFRFWQVGSLTGRGMDVVWQALPFVLAGAVLAVFCGRVLNGLSMGEDVARSLGMNVTLARVVCAVAVVVLCGTATSIAGPIAFAGLVVPHAARLVTGPDYRWILPYSVLIGPSLLLVSDIVGRLVAQPGELQVGVVTAVIGAPVFILLLRKRKRVAP